MEELVEAAWEAWDPLLWGKKKKKNLRRKKSQQGKQKKTTPSVIEVHTSMKYALLLAISWKQTHITKAKYTEQETKMKYKWLREKWWKNNDTYKTCVATTTIKT